MKKKLLLRTNLILCALLAIGFAIVSIANYFSNIGSFRENIENVSELTAESIFHQINAYFTEPVSVSKTMANDALLKSFLEFEQESMDDAAYLARLQEYLNAYKAQYGYDSVFLVSTRTNRYYRYSGLDRVLTPDNPENQWYYSFLASDQAYTLDVDHDESQAADRALTTFVNCKIYGEDGVIGVVGVGVRVGNLQELLQSHKEQYGVRALLIDDAGLAAVTSERVSDNGTSGVIENFAYISDSNLKAVLARAGAGRTTFWADSPEGDCFAASQYIPAMQWHLVVENDTSEIEGRFRRQTFIGAGVTALIALLALIIVYRLVLAYNDRLMKLVVSQELEYHSLLHATIKELYAAVYEFDLTKGRAFGDSTRRDLQRLGLEGEPEYRQTINMIAESFIKEEHREGFLSAAAPENVLRLYGKGIKEIVYECQMNTHWEEYHWVRVQARLFYYSSDKSVHMIVLIRDIHDEKKRESLLLQESMTDPLTGLYNRRFMEEHLNKLIKSLSRTHGALSVLMIDVDFFKKYNDTYGHAAGDDCLREIADILRDTVKREDDFVARYGGEEFIAILPNTDGEGARGIAERMLENIVARAIPHEKNEAATCVTVSIGGATGSPEHSWDMEAYITCADKALYASKSNGRNRYTGETLYG